MSLYDMNKRTGATSIVPGSHTRVQEINDYMAEHVEDAAASEAGSREHSFKRFTSLGLCVRPSLPPLSRAHPDAFSFCRRLAGPAARRA